MLNVGCRIDQLIKNSNLVYYKKKNIINKYKLAQLKKRTVELKKILTEIKSEKKTYRDQNKKKELTQTKNEKMD